MILNLFFDSFGDWEFMDDPYAALLNQMVQCSIYAQCGGLTGSTYTGGCLLSCRFSALVTEIWQNGTL